MDYFKSETKLRIDLKQLLTDVIRFGKTYLRNKETQKI